MNSNLQNNQATLATLPFRKVKLKVAYWSYLSWNDVHGFSHEILWVQEFPHVEATAGPGEKVVSQLCPESPEGDL